MIRGFKMEMTDAQRVTDVYSQVASTTASDSQELATAMSKTASAASSVGMSFENTTAMIATMVEATRESATNIGSAMKSIIARMAEMKRGLSQDKNGEFIDASKVETALKSVGVSLRDTLGQFRDLDIVIGELGAKWDTLDSATQRYLATTIAGNRQQSRFLALMENYDRYTEIQKTAMNAEDAGLLRYSKTLDSVDTKVAQISNSFQQFYMSIVNGPVIGQFLSFLNAMVSGFNKLGNISALFNIASIITGIKTLTLLLVKLFTAVGSKAIIAMKTSMLAGITDLVTPITTKLQTTVPKAGEIGYQAGQNYAQNFAAGLRGQPTTFAELALPPGATPGGIRTEVAGKNSKYAKFGLGLTIAGAGVSAIGANLAGNGNVITGSWTSMGGSALTGAGMGSAFGVPGMIVGGVVGALSQLPAVIEAYGNKAQEAVDNLKKKAEESNLKRAEDKKAYKTLLDYANKIDELTAKRYDSNEAYQEWLDLNNEIVEAYPELLDYIDSEGNAITSLTKSYAGLETAKLQAAQSNVQYYSDQLASLKKQQDLVANQEKLWQDYGLEYSFSGGKISQVTNDYWNWRDEDFLGRRVNRGPKAYQYGQTLAKVFEGIYKTYDLNDKLKPAQIEYYYDKDPTGGMLLKYATMFGKDRAFTGQELVDFISARGYSFGDITSALGSRQNRAAANGKDFTIKKANWDEITNEVELLSQLMVEIGVFSETTGKFTDFGQQIADLSNMTLKIRDAAQSYLSSQIQIFGSASETYKALADYNIQDVDKVISLYAREKARKSAKEGQSIEDAYASYAANLNQKQYDALVGEIRDFFTQADYTTRSAFQDLLSYRNYGSASNYEQEVNRIIGTGNQELKDALIHGYMEQMYQSSNSFISALVKAYSSEDNAFSPKSAIWSDGRLKTYDEWRGGQADTTELKQQYTTLVEGLYAPLAELTKIPIDVLKNLSQTTQDMVGQAAQRVNVLKASGSSAQKAAGENWLKSLTTITSLSPFGGLAADKQNSILSALAADQDENWLKNVYKALEEAGITLTNELKQTLADSVYIAFNTIVENAKSKMSEVSSAIVSAAGNQGKGLTVEEAQKEFKALGLEGKLSDWYHWEDSLGGLVMSSEKFDEAMNQAEETSVGKLKELKADYDEANTAINKIISDHSQVFFSNTYSSEQWAKFLGIEGSELAKGMQDYVSTQQAAGRASDIPTLIQEYFNSLSDQFDDATIKFYEQQIERSKNQAKFAVVADKVSTRKAKYSGPSSISDEDWFTANGYTGPIDEQSLDEYVSSLGYIYDFATGEIHQTEATIEAALKSAKSESVKRYLQAQLDQFREDTGETIGNYFGLVSTEQIRYLEQKGYNISDLKVGDKWTQDLLNTVLAGHDEVLKIVSAGFASNKQTAAAKVKSQTQSMLNDVASTTLNDMIEYVANVTENPDYQPSQEELSKMQTAIDGGLATMINWLKEYPVDEAILAQYEEQYSSSIKDSLEKTLTTLASGGEVLVNDLVSLWESITGKTVDMQTRNELEKAMSQGWQALASYLQNAIATSNIAGDFAGELGDILDSVIDSIRSRTNTILSSIKEGASGNLTKAGITELSKATGISQERIFTGAASTLNGYKLSQNTLLQLASTQGYTYDTAQMIIDEGIVSNYDEIISLIAQIEEKLSGVGEQTAIWGDNASQVLRVLKTAQGILEQTTTNDNWFNPDYYGKKDDKYQQYLDDVAKGSSILQSIQKGEEISRADSQFITQAVAKSQIFQETLAANGKGIEDFYAALANNTNRATGEINFIQALQDMGIAFEDFGQGFAESLSKYADDRIQYLEALKGMIESQVAIAEAMKENPITIPALEFAGDWDNLETSLQDKLDAIKNWRKNIDDQADRILNDTTWTEAFNGKTFTDMLFEVMGINDTKLASMSDKDLKVWQQQATEMSEFISQNLPTIIENTPWDESNSGELWWNNVVEQMRAEAEKAGINLTIPTIVDTKSLRSEVKEAITKLDEETQDNPIKFSVDSLSDEQLSQAASILKGDGSTEEKISALNAIGAAAEAQNTKIQTLQDQITELENRLKAVEGDHQIILNANINPALSTLEVLRQRLETLEKGIIIPAVISQQGGSPSNNNNNKNPGFSMITQATGNVNGLAMYQGTQLAGKTLVGELGPELAVYNNAYHLLGKDGAEFVDIPDNAIIFNHKQTEGIINGQVGVRGKTKNGGPAFATGKAAAIKAIDDEIALWQNFKNVALKDLLGASGGGGGGSGNTIKAHIEDLVEWYNLTRQIADIEQKINNIIAERENITDGHAYLRSLREQQHLLEGQAIVQRTLLNYQQKQVELQAKQINTNSIWSKFFTVGEDGLLQYIMGNEEKGGKGTLSMLQQLNQMSGEQQLSYIKGLGYSYTDNDGNVLDGEDLVAKFYEEAQAQIDKYDELRDTVEETDETLSKLQSSINEIEEEIRQNQLKLEQAIYDSIVSAWEKQISQLTEQMNLLKEANDAYVNGLSDALNKEKNLYSQNQSTSEREQLQRQLSLLRRAGGSASQIASLEEQLDSSLKNEYFNHQQESIDSIKEANEKQIDALNKQITIQQETLDFQKENGVLWTKVYEILSRNDSEILEFLVGNNGEFFTKSALAQREQLNTEWAKSIGIYKENNDVGYIGNRNAAADNFATEAWNSAKGAEKKKQFEAVGKDSQELLKDYFASAYANAKLNGMDDKEAFDTAREDMYKKLYSTYTEQIGAIGGSTGTTDGQTGGGSGNGGSGNGGKGNDKNGKTYSAVSIFVSAGKGGGRPTLASSGGATSAKVAAGSRVVIAPNPFPGYVFDYITYNGTKKSSMSITTTGKVASIDIKVYYKTNGIEKSGGQGGKDATRSAVSAATGILVDQNNQPALLHKGEGVFTAKQTSALIKMVDNFQQLATGNMGASLLASLLSTTKNYSNLRTDSQQVSAVNVNPGAVVIQVEQLNDKYDIDSVATDVFNKITSIASKATNRGVNRR